jgi:hypothetical protein
MKAERLNHLKRFYDLIAALDAVVGGERILAECTKLNWPKRGVYLFTEDGETRSHTGTGPRIVRVGTHALKTTCRVSPPPSSRRNARHGRSWAQGPG